MLFDENYPYFEHLYTHHCDALDFYYKFQDTFFDFRTLIFRKVTICLTFMNMKIPSKLSSTVFGLSYQFFSVDLLAYKFKFGFNKKGRVPHTIFHISDETFVNTISLFFFTNFLSKAVSLGSFPSHDLFSYGCKFFVGDIFNFFGARFFKKFYMDFFDWPGRFVFTFHLQDCLSEFYQSFLSSFKLFKLNSVMFKPKMLRDRVVRFNFYKSEAFVCVNKYIVNSAQFPSEVRIKARFKLFQLHERLGLGHNYTNRCIVTGHPKVAFRRLRLSRMEFRRVAKLGYLRGFRKSGW